MGRTEADRYITNEPWSSMCRSQNITTKTTLRSERSSALKKDLTGPTLLEMSGNTGGLNGSIQHSLEVYSQGAQQLKANREHGFKQKTAWLGLIDCSRGLL